MFLQTEAQMLLPLHQMYSFEEVVQRDNGLDPQNHASTSYSDVERAGVPSRPLDFPTPRVRRVHRQSLLVRDCRTGQMLEVNKALMPVPESKKEEVVAAYLMKKKISKSVYGVVRVAVVLRRTPEIIDHYGIDQVLWECSGETVVIKVSSWARIRQLRGRYSEDPLKESAALQYIGSYHPNIVGCVEVLQDDEFHYTVMQHCRGGDLLSKCCGPGSPSQTRIVIHKVEESQARTWFGQLLAALYHLQRKGVCHRDLSLDNLVLDDNNNLILIDFGLSLRVPYSDPCNVHGVTDVSEGSVRRLIVAQESAGNITYLDPEVIERREAFDGFALDLWAAGVILFALLVGQTPFRWADISDFHFEQITQGRLRELLLNMNVQLSVHAVDLLQNMMRRNPRKRLNLAQVSAHPWVTGDSSLSTIPHALIDKASIKIQPIDWSFP